MCTAAILKNAAPTAVFQSIYYQYYFILSRFGALPAVWERRQADFSVPAAFRAYIPAGSEVAKKARSFRYGYY